MIVSKEQHSHFVPDLLVDFEAMEEDVLARGELVEANDIALAVPSWPACGECGPGLTLLNRCVVGQQW